MAGQSLEDLYRWREDAVRDGWLIESTYKTEPVDDASKLRKDGFVVNIISRTVNAKGKRHTMGSLHIWGPDRLAITPPIPYDMGKIRLGLRVCAPCGAKNVDTQRYGFAGRCCANCRPAMAAKFEKPGWTN